MTDDSAKKAILARRARFIAAAMLGTGLMSCDRKSSEPTVCLSVMPQPPPDPPPQPCLSVAIPAPYPADAGTTTGGGTDDAGAADGGTTDAGPPPAPCLSPPLPPPRPCLSKAPLKPPMKPSICLSFDG